jgi:hypothetical protein
MHIKRKLGSHNVRPFHPWEAPLIQYANHPSSKVQNFPPTITMQHNTHFHQQAITQLARNPLRHQTQISSIIPMNNKPPKAYNLQVNKNNQMQKRTKEFGLLTFTTLHGAQPSCSCHLLPFIHSILEFSHSIHPQKDT